MRIIAKLSPFKFFFLFFKSDRGWGSDNGRSKRFAFVSTPLSVYMYASKPGDLVDLFHAHCASFCTVEKIVKLIFQFFKSTIGILFFQAI